MEDDVLVVPDVIEPEVSVAVVDIVPLDAPPVPVVVPT